MTSELIVYRQGEVLDLSEAEPSISRAIRWGALVILIAFGGALGWGFLAALDSAAHATGVIVVEGNRKTIQHLEGGIVAELKVRDNDVVQPGQVLLRLDATKTQATLEELMVQYWDGLIRVARLRMEQIGRRTFSVPSELAADNADPAAKRAINVQQRLFMARWVAHDSEIEVLREQRLQAEQEIQAYGAKMHAAIEQIAFAREELTGVQELFDKGLERKPRVMSVKRYLAEVIGTRDESKARIAQTEQSMTVIEAQMRDKEKKRLSEIAAELEEAQGKLAETTARIKAARDAVARTEIRSPVAGRVVSLAAFTIGGVIKAGEPILEVVPATEKLTLDARVQPTDIDVVHPGQSAQVHLTAFKQRRTPTIDATVINVSADRLVDPNTGEAYFLARVQPKPGALEQLDHVDLYPGMPAEVLIATGKRRAIDYFLSPLQDSMARALIED
jgi:HlyD family type I secretion membrane fusion protein